MCTQGNGHSTLLLPENNNDSIENIIAIANVAERTLGHNFKEHLHSKHRREDVVACLDNGGQCIWLVLNGNNKNKLEDKK